MDIIKLGDSGLTELNAIRDSIREKHKKISETPTGEDHIKTLPWSGYDYLEGHYMASQLYEYYPIWSWEGLPLQFIGSEWIVASGHLIIEDNGIIRKFLGGGAARIMFKEGQPHTPENVVNIDHNVGAAITNAFKRAINRLTNIGDDVYKRVDEFLEKKQIEEYIKLANKLPEAKKKLYLTYLKNDRVNRNNFDDAITTMKKLIKEEKEKEKS